MINYYLFFDIKPTVMILINAIIFSEYMICEVYRSHPWRHWYPPDIRRTSAIRIAGSGGNFYDVFRCFNPSKRPFAWKDSGARHVYCLWMFSSLHYIQLKKFPPWDQIIDPILKNTNFTKFSKGKSYWRHTITTCLQK